MMGKKQRTRGKIFRHPLFLRLLQAFCIFEPIPTEAASPTSKLAEAPNRGASGHRKKNGPEATTKLDIGGVI
jgi:hypothetical protein